MISQKSLYIVSFLISFLVFLSVSKILGIVLLILLVLYINLPIIMVYRGNVHYVRKNYDQALKLYRRAYKSWHSSSKVKVSYGYVLLRMGMVEESEKALAPLKNAKLNDAEALNWKLTYSLLLWKKGQLDEAINLLIKEYQSKKNTVLYENVGYFLLLNKEYERALEFNLEAYEYNSSDASILDNLAESYYFTGNYDKALEIYDKLMAMKPTFVTAYYFYGKTLLKKERFKEAVDAFTRASECNFSFLTAVSKEEVDAALAEAKTLL